MRILILSQVFYPDVVAVAQYLTDFAIDLRSAGCEVKVLASRRGYDDRSQVYPTKENVYGIEIERISSTYLGKRSYVARVVDALTFNLMLVFKLITATRYDVVIGMTTPPLIAVIGSLFCLFKKRKFVYWVMDLNPDEAIQVGILKKDSLLTRILERISRFTFRHSHLILALDHYMAKRIMLKGIDSGKIRILPPWAHINDLKFIPHQQNVFRQTHQLKEKFVVMYSGNHSICHPLETVLKAAHILRDHPSVVFLFIGGGERVKEVCTYKEKHGLDNIIQLPYQSFSSLSYSLSAADVHVVTMGDAYAGIVHPSKIYDMLWIGRPFIFIGPGKSHIGDLVRNLEIGHMVDHGDVDELVKQVLHLHQLPLSETKRIQRISQAAAKENYSRQVLTSQLIQWLKGVSHL